MNGGRSFVVERVGRVGRIVADLMMEHDSETDEEELHKASRTLSAVTTSTADNGSPRP